MKIKNSNKTALIISIIAIVISAVALAIVLAVNIEASNKNLSGTTDFEIDPQVRTEIDNDKKQMAIINDTNYLIKEANFDLFGSFKNKYTLKNSVVIRSGEFNGTAPGKTYFPIIIGFYKKDAFGMTYDYIKNYKFQTKEGQFFSLKNMVSIKNFLSKYPNGRYVSEKESVAKFFTMRDINALKRSRTFITENTYNTIYVKKEKLPYYCYVDIFKKYIPHIPYYLGNCDVFIDNEKFEGLKDCFVYLSAKETNFLRQYVTAIPAEPEKRVDNYFREVLGEHYA
jgi:hypothetical protein